MRPVARLVLVLLLHLVAAALARASEPCVSSNLKDFVGVECGFEREAECVTDADVERCLNENEPLLRKLLDKYNAYVTPEAPPASSNIRAWSPKSTKTRTGGSTPPAGTTTTRPRAAT